MFHRLVVPAGGRQIDEFRGSACPGGAWDTTTIAFPAATGPINLVN
jgi:hypothetical protein